MLYSGNIIDNTYYIENEIGHGGMGVIYRAYHLRLQKYVVLKKLKMAESYSPVLLRTEVDSLKKLHHTYLPQVYDYIKHEGDIYTIIDYIEGCDLEKYIISGVYIEESQLIKWLKQLCEVLVYVHSQGIIHADIKPANIIVTPSGDICLIDFGISFNEHDKLIKGYSRNYSSPEQYYVVYCIQHGIPTDVRPDEQTDIYSLGITFYHLMTGQKPDIEDIHQPMLSEFSLNYSDILVGIIDKAIRRDTAERFADMKQMYQALNDMRKKDIRYRKYIILQILTSFVAVVMILAGVSIVILETKQKRINRYSAEYNQFIVYCENGDVTNAINTAENILHNKDYESFCREREHFYILYSLGEVYYDNNNYANAVQYYKRAYRYVESMKEESKDYYRNYAIALVRNGDFVQAQKIIDEISRKYSSQEVVTIINAQMNYQQGEYRKSIGLLDSLENAVLSSEEKYGIYVLYSDNYSKLGMYEEAVKALDKARNFKEDVYVLRKLAGAYLNLAYSSEGTTDNQSLNYARGIYALIESQYALSVDDGINYSQTYRLTGNAPEALRILQELDNKFPENYRIYMHMAITYSSIHNVGKTAECCARAREYYLKAGETQKAEISEHDLDTLKGMYQEYCQRTW